ncbi:MAG: carboxypeptidase-like regulatory domain-containing protein, partial [Nocardioidaceae bacterium]
MSTCRPRRTRLWLVVAASVSLVVALLATTPAGASSPAGSTTPRQAGTAQLSGTVTDGSGHGWPMYAEITIDGYDGGPIFTNPYTGHYSVDLPAAASYQLHVEAVDMPGYTPADVTVDLGSGGAREDIALIVDAATCTAPGYATTSVGAVTDFERWTGSTPRDGWSITDQSGNGEAWEFDDPGGRGNLTGDDGTFAIVDSGYFGFGTVQNTSLVSPVLDMSDQARPVVELDTAYQWYFGAGVDVDLSVDGGQTWTNVWEHTIPSIVDHLQV